MSQEQPPSRQISDLEFESICKVADIRTEEALMIASKGRYGVFRKEDFSKIYAVILADMLRRFP